MRVLCAFNPRFANRNDNGEKELGGEVFYAHTIGEVQQSQTTNEQWTPDLFAAVSREHSQRIVSVSVVNATPQFFAINRTPFIVGVQGAIITVLIPGGGINGSGLPSSFMLANNNSVLLFSAAIAGAITQAIIITSAVQTITTSVAITAQNAPPIIGSFPSYHSSVFLTGFFGTVGTIAASGGSGDYVYVAPSGFSVQSGGVIRVSASAAGLITATITITDNNNDRVSPTAIMLTISAITQCGFISYCPALGYVQGSGPSALPPSESQARMMIAAGADVNLNSIANNDNSPLHHLIEIGGDESLWQLLLDSGANINQILNIAGSMGTALDFLNQLPVTHRQGIAWLVSNGARCRINCRPGQLPL